jgi:hypothetical protein
MSDIVPSVWTVLYLPQAQVERSKLPARERVAVDRAVEKLEALGAQLPYPHSSHVQQADNLRELRPRGGNSPWRALYRKIGDVFVIAAVCPEAQQDRRKFDRGCDDAADRLAELEAGEDEEANAEQEEEE